MELNIIWYTIGTDYTIYGVRFYLKVSKKPIHTAFLNRLMRCPTCHSKQTQVIDSRSVGDDFAIRRRRRCLRCRFRFSTYEEIELLNFYVIKKDGSRQLYDRNKLVDGLRKACEKRPISADSFDKVVFRIEREIRKGRKKEVSSKVIGEIVMKELRKIDEIAYIRFASVYRSFKDVESFRKELKALFK